LRFTRQRFQRGSLRRVRRSQNQWAWEYRYKDPTTQRQQSMYLSCEQFPTQAAVERHLEAFVLKLNCDNPVLAVRNPTFGALIDRFIEDERLLEIKKVRPGERCDNELSYRTVGSYLSVLKKIRARWGTTRLDRVKPMAVQEWLKALDAAPKTKGHVKALMHRLFEKAMLWEMIEVQRNPMQLVEVKGISKRLKKPLILTVGEHFLVLDLLPQPYHTMVVIAQCLGLRAEEILALHWSDVSFERLIVRVSRAVVSGRIKTVKTEYSEDELPLDPDFATVLLDWKTRAPASALMFPSHVTGRNFHASPIQQDYIRPAGCCLVACPNCSATSGMWCKDENGKRVGLHDERWDSAGSFGHVGWHTFRHTYRSWLDATGAPLGVQQKLMRHAQISTTMNVYGNALMDSKRDANSRVAKLALGLGLGPQNTQPKVTVN
jgi:integrase